MIEEWSNHTPVGRLKNFSLKQIQDAISEALLKLVGEDAGHDGLTVSIKSLEIDGWFSTAKMSIQLHSASEEKKERQDERAVVATQ